MAVVKEKVCRRESQRSIALSGKLKKDGVEGVNSAASAAYLNEALKPIVTLPGHSGLALCYRGRCASSIIAASCHPLAARCFASKPL